MAKKRRQQGTKFLCNPKALGYTLAVLFGGYMLIASVIGLLGYYGEAIELMKKWHIFFDLTPIGIIAGIIEGAIFGYITGAVSAYLYNKFL